MTAKRLKDLGLIDKIVREPIGGAHRNPTQMAKRLKAVLMNELDALENVPVPELLDRRRGAMHRRDLLDRQVQRAQLPDEGHGRRLRRPEGRVVGRTVLAA